MKQISAGAATAETVNDPWKADRLGRQINFLAKPHLLTTQDFHHLSEDRAALVVRQ